MLVLWTDGSANPNPGPGGWAVVNAANEDVVLTGYESYTTNIRMEGAALIEAIKYAILCGEAVEICTDSEFWVNVLTKWAPVWKRNGWRKKTGEIKNLDLVKELYELYSNHEVELTWVKAHVGTELNEIADIAAKAAARFAAVKRS